MSLLSSPSQLAPSTTPELLAAFQEKLVHAVAVHSNAISEVKEV